MRSHTICLTICTIISSTDASQQHHYHRTVQHYQHCSSPVTSSTTQQYSTGQDHNSPLLRNAGPTTLKSHSINLPRPPPQRPPRPNLPLPPPTLHPFDPPRHHHLLAPGTPIRLVRDLLGRAETLRSRLRLDVQIKHLSSDPSRLSAHDPQYNMSGPADGTIRGRMGDFELFGAVVGAVEYDSGRDLCVG